MKTTHLYNTAHPLAESGKPIFIPFGEWKYDGATRQRLDRAHGERIANELNARVSRGEPGIPVYAGHPDVPQLAAKYPDKGALGWVEKIELVNEGGRDGLALTVAWDRDPGRGFRWFSPYWLANGREGSTYVVDSIASIGLVNNPNIPEFRLANEERDPPSGTSPSADSGFNSRAHEERDSASEDVYDEQHVSIHALMRSATMVDHHMNYRVGVSIHALTRSATKAVQGAENRQKFQFTRSRGARLSRTRLPALTRRFNSRAHEERDHRAFGLMFNER